MADPADYSPPTGPSGVNGPSVMYRNRSIIDRVSTHYISDQALRHTSGDHSPPPVLTCVPEWRPFSAYCHYDASLEARGTCSFLSMGLRCAAIGEHFSG